MDLLRTIIIDDELKGINTLKILIEKYIEGVIVVADTTDATKGIELIENYKPEIVLLDINMPLMTGFELLEKVKWKNFNLVFTTAHQEHGLKALKLNAIDYLLKPIDYKELQIAVNKIRSHIENDGNDKNELDYNALINSINQYQLKKIIVNNKAGIESIYLPEIVYLEAESNYTKICLTDGQTITTSKTLKEFDVQLCVNDTNFMRVHNSYVINLNQVKRYLKDEENLVMFNNQKIPLAKSRRDVFFKWLKI